MVDDKKKWGADAMATNRDEQQRQLRGLADIVIELFNTIDEVYEPDWPEGVDAVMYLTEPLPDPKAKLNYLYTRADSLRDRKRP